MPAIEVKNLKKSYGNTVALNGISFNVEEGEIFGLLGPNGAGKTTAIDIIAGLLTKDSGEVKILNKMPDDAKQEMNVVSSNTWLTGIMSVYENLKVYGMLYGVKDLDERIGNLLELFEMKKFRNELYQRLSAGQQTRVNLCKGLINSPKILLLDECTAGLDPNLADKTRKIIKGLKKKTAILFTSHNMLEVERLCDRIAFLQSGAITWMGPSNKLKQMHGKRTLEEVFIKLARGQA
ncbi:ABC transporter ATP-binding protein [Candidatus Woesearchaeota archaeon]|nr:ABC transporter ATP-binding protein [Candidatus Woesearchaeota archaeon]